MKRGRFISFEGCEGSGKSTQIERSVTYLRSKGIVLEVLREPGGTRIGEMVRGVLLDIENTMMFDRAELMLYEASRVQLVEERIRPAVEVGVNVICDRFCDSTTAYQGFGRGMDLAMIQLLNKAATDGLMPDVTICLDIDASTGLARATKEGADRLEAEEVSFHERVREGYHWIAKEEPGRFILVDASGSPDEVFGRVRSLLDGAVKE